MPLTEQTAIDKVEVLETGVIQVRQISRVIKDDSIIAETYQRWTLQPGDDVTDQDEKVARICEAAWTPDVLAAWQERQQQASAPIES